MTVTAAEKVHTLAELRECTAYLLLACAAAEEPDTYGCGWCDTNTMCAPHCEQASVMERLERAARMALRATTEDEVRAAVAHARGDGGIGK